MAQKKMVLKVDPKRPERTYNPLTDETVLLESLEAEIELLRRTVQIRSLHMETPERRAYLTAVHSELLALRVLAEDQEQPAQRTLSPAFEGVTDESKRTNYSEAD